MTTSNITVYGAHWCPDCRTSKQILGEHQIPYNWVDIEEDLEGEKFAIKKNDGKRIIPTILFAGGAEFGGQMAAADRQAIKLAGGPAIPISIVPAAAAPDHNHQRAGQNGVNWFKDLGATNVSVVPLVDNTTANDPAVVEALSQAGLIYLLGGFPGHLATSLRGSRSWQAIMAAYQTGAVIAGSSAGAMVLCEYFYDPGSSRVVPGLELLKGPCILPHHDTFGKNWAARLLELLPNTAMLGIDEETGVICRVSEGLGRVHGKGEITLYRRGKLDTIGPEQEFKLSLLNI